MDHIVDGWTITHPWWFALCVAGATIFIRAVSVGFRVFQFRVERKRCKTWWLYFWSLDDRWHPNERDFWLPTALGTLELLAYPALIKVGAWQAIGGWLGLPRIETTTTVISSGMPWCCCSRIA